MRPPPYIMPRMTQRNKCLDCGYAPRYGERVDGVDDEHFTSRRRGRSAMNTTMQGSEMFAQMTGRAVEAARPECHLGRQRLLDDRLLCA